VVNLLRFTFGLLNLARYWGRNPPVPFLGNIMSILDLNVYKEFQGITSDTNDNKLTKIIHAVNAFIPSYCNRSFIDYYSTPKVEYFDATQQDYFPQEFPILTVSSVKYSSNNDGVYDTTLTEYTDYVVDRLASRIVAVGYQFIYSPIEINSGQLTYTAGYSEYPEDIVQAAVLLTEYFAEEAYNPRKSLSGSSIDHTVQVDLTARLPQHIRRILEHHRAWNP